MKQPPKRKNTRRIAFQGQVVLHHPRGIKLDDIYMDAQQVAQELNFSKRTVRNMRISGRLSFTTLYGKIFYFRQEIAGTLAANKTTLKAGILKKIS